MVSVELWMESSRIRCRILLISPVAPSAIWTRAMPSSAFDLARPMPRILERMVSDTERPAASSEARLMRRPVDSFSRDLLRDTCWVLSEPWPIIEEILWLIRMEQTSLFFPRRPGFLAWDGPIMPVHDCLSAGMRFHFKDYWKYFPACAGKNPN